MKSHMELSINHEKKHKSSLSWTVSLFLAVKQRQPQADALPPFPPPITTGLAIKLQYACEYIIDVETAIPIMPQTFYTFEVCGYRVIIPYNTFPSLGCAGCHKKWFVQVPSYRSYVNRYLKYIVFYTWSPSLLRICSNKNNWIVWEPTQ